MPIKKIEAGRVITQDIDQFIGTRGTIWYDEETGEMRLYDGNPGGVSLGAGGGGYVLHTATITRLGGVRIGVGINVSPNGTISVNTGTPYSLTAATTSTLGGVIIGAGIDVSPSGVISVNTGTTFNLNTATTSTLGGVKIGAGINVSADGTISVNTNTSTYFTLTAGTDTAVSTSTGNVTIWTTSTLQSVTDRGSSTSNAINITSLISTTSTTTGALTVAGGVGIGGDLFVGGDITGPNGSLVLVATTSTAPNRQNGQLWFNSTDGRAYIKYDGNWVDLSPTIVPPISTYLGDLTIDGTTISTIDNTLTNIYIDSILDVSGAIYTNNYLVSTLTNISGGIGISVSRTNSGTVTVNNAGVLEIVAGVDTSVTTTTGVVIINNTSTLQSVTNRGSTTSNAINITSLTATTSTTTGALIVAGGVGIGGDIFVNGDIKNANGSLIHVATTSTAPTRDNGQLWFNSEDGRGYIKYDGTWVDFNPSIVPPTSTYLDGLVVEGTTIRTVDTTATTVYIDRNLDVAGEIFRNGISIGYGYTGSRGTDGVIGYNGSVGYTGSTGAGYTGSKGDQGTPGTSVKIVGSTSTSTLLITPWTGDIGDGFIVTADGHLWVWTDPWVDVGVIIGYTGSVGYTGSIAGLSSNGTDTVTLLSGFKFIPETDKLQDLGTPTNRFGKLYLAGQTIYLDNTIISTGIDGDLQLRKSNGDLERLTASSLRLGSTGTNGVVFSFNSGTLSIDATTTNFISIVSTGTVSVLNAATSTSTDTGALIVSGGVGIGGSVYASSIYDSGNRVVTNVTPNGSAYIGITDLISTGTATSFTIVNLGVQTLTAGTDTVVSSDTGTVTVWTNSTLQSITDRGSSTTNAILILNTTSSTSSTTGALVVGGGVGVAGDIYFGGNLYQNGVLFTGGGGGGSYDQSLNTTSNVTFANITIGPGGVITFPNGATQSGRAPRMIVDDDFINAPDYDAFFATLLPGDFYWSVTYSQIKILVDYGGYYDWQDLTVYAA